MKIWDLQYIFFSNEFKSLIPFIVLWQYAVKSVSKHGSSNKQHGFCIILHIQQN